MAEKIVVSGTGQEAGVAVSAQVGVSKVQVELHQSQLRMFESSHCSQVLSVQFQQRIAEIEAEQKILVHQLLQVQAQFQGQVQETAEAVPAVQRFVGVEERVCKLSDQHTQFITGVATILVQVELQVFQAVQFRGQLSHCSQFAESVTQSQHQET